MDFLAIFCKPKSPCDSFLPALQDGAKNNWQGQGQGQGQDQGNSWRGWASIGPVAATGGDEWFDVPQEVDKNEEPAGV